GMVHYKLGTVFENQKMYDKAIEKYQTVLSMNPDFVMACNNLAYLLAEQGKDLKNALKLAEKANKLFPNRPEIMDTVGWVYYKHKDYKNAVEMLEKANKLNANNPFIQYHLGASYYHTGKKDEAKKMFEDVLKAYPDFEKKEEIKKILND
ncbi:tetratricopeptide repeat protein, partial [bacterium]|nr:tetratricopeptide repeat protein [bacterium]